MQVCVTSLTQQARFVTGGVSMATLPETEIPEVAFVGRSNVGKSSLINMVLGRRAIAYTSKLPGKTQQYNYFVLNEGRAGASFHLVDLPGFGFAKAPASLRRQWLNFLAQYTRERPQLQLIVHLVDSQVGPQAADLSLMQMVGEARHWFESEGRQCPWHYRIVLTKVDKCRDKVSASILNRVRQGLNASDCPENMPLVVSSSKSRLGRDHIWRLLRHVALRETAPPLSIEG